MNRVFPELQVFIEKLDFSNIPGERKELLQPLISYLQEKLNKSKRICLNFICTHNSRRSQLCQVWAETAACYFGLKDFKAFSGGTEATAFHPNAVRALKEAGFTISKEKEEENPIYQVLFSTEAGAISCFSKLFYEALPDSISFAAVLTCADAEANCPFIPEAEGRFSLKYEDPKKADGSPQEKQVYAERNRQIATELFYVFSKIKFFKTDYSC